MVTIIAFWSPSVVRWVQWNGSVVKIGKRIYVQNVDANHLRNQPFGRPRSRGCVTR